MDSDSAILDQPARTTQRRGGGPHRTVVAVLLLLVVTAGQPCVAAAGEGWPRWRGPAQDGSASSDGLFDPPELGLELVWSRELGSGYSGISVIFGVALTAHTDGDDDVVVALEAATGQELWRYVLGPRYGGHDGSHDGPLSTPVVAEGRVFALAPRGRLVALELLTGDLLWSTDLVADHGAEKPFYGFTTTPLVVGERLVVQVVGEAGAFVALDVVSGEQRWATGSAEASYQSPIRARLAGEDLVLAVGETSVTALGPETGAERWRYDTDETWDGSLGGVVPLDGERLLLHNGRQSRVLRIARESETTTFEVLWTSNGLRANFGAPVYYDGHLYGYSGRFLTCVRASDGETVWRSRPPGGIGLIRVDDHLVLGSREGGVVVVAASPEGYVERARHDLGERASYTAPSFAGGLIFHRDLDRMAVLRPIAQTVQAAEPVPSVQAPRTAFENFVASLEGARNPHARVNAFFASQSRWPIIEGEIVHFVYRGPASDVGLAGSWLPGGKEVSLERVSGTDLYFHTTELPRDSRVDYWLTLDFEDSGPDPRNPRQVAHIRPWGSFDYSELRMPDFVAPAFEAGIEAAAGVFESFELDSAIRGNRRTIEVYRPAGVAESGPLDLLVLVQGEVWQDRGDLPALLDRLAADTGEAPLVAFVGGIEEQPWQETGGVHSHDYAAMLAQELVPALAQRYPLADDAAARTVAGSYDGAVTAILAGLAHPEIFGGVVALSPEWNDDAQRMAAPWLEAEGGAKTRIAVESWHYDANREAGKRSMAEAAETLRHQLGELGFEVAGEERPGGSGWGIWPGRLVEDLAPSIRE